VKISHCGSENRSTLYIFIAKEKILTGGPTLRYLGWHRNDTGSSVWILLSQE
jgi:hypothetical protein